MANRRGHSSSGSGKANSSSNSKTSKNRGARHGHGHKGKGKGNPGGGSGNIRNPSNNPTNTTLSEAMERYGASNIGELNWKMRLNPAEYMSVSDLIDDSEDTDTTDTTDTNTNTNPNSNMSTIEKQNTIQDIYGTHLGRKAGAEGLSYWTDQLTQGKSVKDVIRGIQSGSEYKARSDYRTANPNATEADLDAHISPGGGRLDPNAAIGYEAPTFAADNTWSSPLMTSGNNTWTDELENIYRDLKIGGASETGSPHYNTAPAANTGAYNVGVTHDSVGNPITNTGGGSNDNNNNNTGDNNNNNNNTNTSWLDQYADIDAFKDALGLNQTQTNSKWDDFNDFMTALGPFLGGGGGYSYPSMGYGGYSPGGVASANPYGNMMNFMNAFKNMNQGSNNSSLQTNSLST